jgi:exosortase/archaeosortase family protein
LSANPGKKVLKNAGQLEKSERRRALKKFYRSFLPLMLAVLLWIITISILHLPGIKEEAMQVFIQFTLSSALVFGKLFFIPVESLSYPNITVSGYTMKIVMECTAYNFYIFVIFLSLLSPVKWKQRIITLLIFIGAVFIVNNLRFITMGYIGNYSGQLFHLIHDYLWNILFGFMVFLIWAWRYNRNIEDTNDSKN